MQLSKRDIDTMSSNLFFLTTKGKCATGISPVFITSAHHSNNAQKGLGTPGAEADARPTPCLLGKLLQNAYAEKYF
jgi:hypothetical protein